MLLFTPYIASAAGLAPTLISEGETGAMFTPTASHVITGLGSETAGDLIVVFAAFGGGLAATSVSVDTGASGSNWTIRDQGARSTACVLACITKTAEGSDALTITSNATSYGVWQAYRIPAGAHEGTGTRVSNFNAGGTADPPSLTPAGGSAEYIWMAACAVGANTTLSSGPTDYTTEDTLNSLATNGGKLAVAWRTLTASSENPGAFTWGASINFVTNTFAFSG